MGCAAPVLTVHLFPTLLDHLIDVLEPLSTEEWNLPTPCPGWSVHDLTAHILGGEVGQLSRGRDDFHASLIAANEWGDFVAGLNDLNEQWIKAMRGVSARLMIDLLQSTGEQTNRYLQSLDPYAPGPVVSWASAKPAAMWLHIAREYTERWHHQQQVRQALGRPLLAGPHWLAPALATFVHGLPRTYSNFKAPVGSAVRFTIEGPSGGTWLVKRDAPGWVLCDDETVGASAQVMIDELDAWKLFTKSMPMDVIGPRVVVNGDQSLGLKALETVSIIA